MKTYFSSDDQESNIHFEIDLQKWSFLLLLQFSFNYLSIHVLCFEVTFWFGDLKITQTTLTEDDINYVCFTKDN